MLALLLLLLSVVGWLVVLQGSDEDLRVFVFVLVFVMVSVFVCVTLELAPVTFVRAQRAKQQRSVC